MVYMKNDMIIKKNIYPIDNRGFPSIDKAKYDLITFDKVFHWIICEKCEWREKVPEENML